MVTNIRNSVNLFRHEHCRPERSLTESKDQPREEKILRQAQDDNERALQHKKPQTKTPRRLEREVVGIQLQKSDQDKTAPKMIPM